jgi:hypothetical protein
MKASYFPKHRPGRRYVMSHMIADTEEELHAMAKKIGVNRRWYQGDHYDVTQSARHSALHFGAVSITLRQCSRMVMNRRRGGNLGTPEEAQAWLDEMARKMA